MEVRKLNLDLPQVFALSAFQFSKNIESSGQCIANLSMKAIFDEICCNRLASSSASQFFLACKEAYRFVVCKVRPLRTPRELALDAEPLPARNVSEEPAVYRPTF